MRIREYQLKYGITLDEPVEEEKDFDHEEEEEEVSTKNTTEEPLPLNTADNPPKNPKKAKNQRKKKQRQKKKQKELEIKLLAEGKAIPTVNNSTKFPKTNFFWNRLFLLKITLLIHSASLFKKVRIIKSNYLK